MIVWFGTAFVGEAGVDMVFMMVTRLRSRRAELSLLPTVHVPRLTPREPSGTKRLMSPPEQVRSRGQRVWRQSKVRGPRISFLLGVNRIFTGEMPSLRVGVDLVASTFRAPRFSLYRLNHCFPRWRCKQRESTPQGWHTSCIEHRRSRCPRVSNREVEDRRILQRW